MTEGTSVNTTDDVSPWMLSGGLSSPQSHTARHSTYGALYKGYAFRERTGTTTRHTHTMSSSGQQNQQKQIPKSLQGLAKANKATGLLMAYTAAFLTLG